MKNTNQNHTDNFFRQGLSKPPEFTPSEKNWQAMEQLLKSKAQRRSVGWIYVSAGIAAALLVFLAFWLGSPQSAGTDQQVKAGKDVPTSTPPVPGPGVPPAKENLTSGDSNTGRKTFIAEVPKSSSRNGIKNPVTHSEVTEPESVVRPQDLVAFVPLSIHGTSAAQAVESPEVAMISLNTSGNQRNNPKAGRLTPDESSDSRSGRLPGRWGLSMALSPDLNSVDGMDNNTFGLSLGAGLTYKLGKTLSVATGVYYSRKLYSADKTSYKVKEKPFATWTSYSNRIDADCRVIDIPVNLSFKVSNSKQHKLYATAGLSSYIMLSEKYDFKYNPSPAYPTGSREYTVRNQNEHILSVVNLGIAVEKPLNDQMSLVIQPYAKLPLTGIGQGETDLRSFGLGLRLNYSLLKKK